MKHGKTSHIDQRIAERIVIIDCRIRKLLLPFNSKSGTITATSPLTIVSVSMTARAGRVMIPVNSKLPILTSASLRSLYCSHRTLRLARLSDVDISAVHSLVVDGTCQFFVAIILRDPIHHSINCFRQLNERPKRKETETKWRIAPCR